MKEVEEIQWEKELKKQRQEVQDRQIILQQLDREKWENIRQKEEISKNKKLETFRNREEQEFAKDLSFQQQLQTIEDKQLKSARFYEEAIMKKVHQANKSNSQLSAKIKNAQELKANQVKAELEKFEQNEEKLKQKLTTMYEEMQDQLEKSKRDKRIKLRKHLRKRKIEEDTTEQKLQEINQRLEMAEQKRNQNKEEFQKELQIKYELRELKEENQWRLLDRNKRKMNKKKLFILVREKQHEVQIRAVKDHEQMIIKKKHELNMMAIAEKQKMKESFNLIMSKSLPSLKDEMLKKLPFMKRDVSQTSMNFY